MADPIPLERLVQGLDADLSASPLSGSPGKQPTTRVLFDIPSQLDLVEPLVAYLTHQCHRMGMAPEAVTTAVPLSLTEALVNAIEHGNGSKLPKRVEADAEITDARFRIHVTDEGEGFDPRLVPIPTEERYLVREHGRGLFLIGHYMDEVHFNRAGNRITMVKRCPPRT